MGISVKIRMIFNSRVCQLVVKNKSLDFLSPLIPQTKKCPCNSKFLQKDLPGAFIPQEPENCRRFSSYVFQTDQLY